MSAATASPARCGYRALACTRKAELFYCVIIPYAVWVQGSGVRVHSVLGGLRCKNEIHYANTAARCSSRRRPVLAAQSRFLDAAFASMLTILEDKGRS